MSIDRRSFLGAVAAVAAVPVVQAGGKLDPLSMTAPEGDYPVTVVLDWTPSDDSGGLIFIHRSQIDKDWILRLRQWVNPRSTLVYEVRRPVWTRSLSRDGEWSAPESARGYALKAYFLREEVA